MVRILFGDVPARKRPSKGEKQLLYDVQKGKCNYCGKKLELAYLHSDHKNPVSRGGSDRSTNKQLLCSPCNSRKGAMTDGEFRRRYKLPGVRKANGPPKKLIPQSYFEDISEAVTNRKAKSRRKAADEYWW